MTTNNTTDTEMRETLRMAMNDFNRHVANTILEQLGGRRFTLMTGARNFVAGQSELSFRLPNNAANGINVVSIKLTARDDYDLTFSRLRRTKQGVTMTVVDTRTGIYCDQLRDVFERVTQLATRL